MTAIGGFRDWTGGRWGVVARCLSCNRHLVPGTAPDGTECAASILVMKATPLGVVEYRATCRTSVERGECNAPHFYRCELCDFSILID